MNYTVLILRRAQKELAAIANPVYRRLNDAIRALATNPRPAGSAKLTAREGWRIRVGDFRVLYDIDDAAKTVTVLHIGNRRDVYR